MKLYHVDLNGEEFGAIFRAIDESLEIALDGNDEYEYAGKLYSAKVRCLQAERKVEEAPD